MVKSSCHGLNVSVLHRCLSPIAANLCIEILTANTIGLGGGAFGKCFGWYSALVNRIYFLVQSLVCVWLFAIPWTATRQASPSFTISQSLLKLMCIESVMPSNYLILCRPLLLPPSKFPSIRVFSNESALLVAKVLEFQPQHQSFQWTPRTDLL